MIDPNDIQFSAAAGNNPQNLCRNLHGLGLTMSIHAIYQNINLYNRMEPAVSKGVRGTVHSHLRNFG